MAPPLQEFLTYEDVMKVYREEQKRAGLTEVRKDFYPALRQLTERLTRDHEKETALDPYSVKTRTLRKQLENLREMAPRIFEYRAGKVAQMAVRAMGGAKLDLSRLTEEEKTMFENVLHRTSECRQAIFGPQEKREVVAAVSTTPVTSTPPPKPAIMEEPMPPAPLQSAAASSAPKQETIEAKSGPDDSAQTKTEVGAKTPVVKEVLLRILEDLPSFAGPDGTYRLRKEDVVTLPEAIGRTLVKKGKAEEIRPGVL